MINNLRLPTVDKSHMNVFRLKITQCLGSSNNNAFRFKKFFLKRTSLKNIMYGKHCFTVKLSRLLKNYFTSREAQVDILPSSRVATHKI